MKALISVLVMAVVTYIPRVFPLVIFRRPIDNIYIKSFLFYVPYAVLAALTFPAIFTATGNVVTSTAGTLVALVLAYFDTGLVIVAVGAVAGALLAGIF